MFADTETRTEKISINSPTLEMDTGMNVTWARATIDKPPTDTHYRDTNDLKPGKSKRPTLAQMLETGYEETVKEQPKEAENDINDSKESYQLENMNSDPEKNLPEKSETKNEEKAPVRFGWIEGVFVRCLLNIWGVMLFLRLSWIVGQSGVLYTIVIILLSAVVTTITTTSMSAICTNGQVKGGGAYFMISRSLGPQFGGAIGLIFSLANAISVAMYIAGFTETVITLYPQPFTGSAAWDMRIIGILTTIVLLGITQAGMAWESKMQIVLLIILLISIVNWFVGSFLTSINSSVIIDEASSFFKWNGPVLAENLGPDYQLKTPSDPNSPLEDFFEVVKTLTYYEIQYSLDSASFYQQFEQGLMGDDIDFIRWANQYEIHQQLKMEIESVFAFLDEYPLPAAA